MKVCSHCGKALSDDSQFCRYCGAAVNTADIIENNTGNGHIHFKRESAVLGVLAKVKIIINGRVVDGIRNNSESDITLPYGKYNVELNNGKNYSLYLSVTLDSLHTSAQIIFKLSANGKPALTGEVQPNVTPQMPPKKSSKMGTWAYILIFLIVFFTAKSVISILSDNESYTDNNQTVSQADTNNGSSAVAEKSFEKITGTVDNWEITVNDFNCKQSVSVGLLHEYTAEQGSKYCMINISAKNIGKESAVFLPYIVINNEVMAKIMWGDYEYTRSDLVFSDDNLSSESANPLVSVEGNIAFELPDDVINSDVPPVLVFSAGNTSFSCDLVKK